MTLVADVDLCQCVAVRRDGLKENDPRNVPTSDDSTETVGKCPLLIGFADARP
jgi:hypothetical protein